MLDNIKILPFKVKHLRMLVDMHKSQKYLGINDIVMKNLPKIGFIAIMGDFPIAAGFLRKVEGGYAQLDTLVSNSEFGSQIRHKGISLVVDELIITAKQMKLKAIIAHTADSSVIMRAKALGFHEVEQKIIALPLS